MSLLVVTRAQGQLGPKVLGATRAPGPGAARGQIEAQAPPHNFLRGWGAGAQAMFVATAEAYQGPPSTGLYVNDGGCTISANSRLQTGATGAPGRLGTRASGPPRPGQPGRWGGAPLREDLSTEYGLRFSTEIYGSKREKTVFHEYIVQGACFVLKEISENLRKPPGVLRENVI